MRITVRAHTKSKKPRILEREPGIFDVYVSEVPEAGKANTAIIASLARYFKVPKSAAAIVRGASSKSKIIEIALPKKRKGV